jgi:hypothetical protein
LLSVVSFSFRRRDQGFCLIPLVSTGFSILVFDGVSPPVPVAEPPDPAGRTQFDAARATCIAF